MERMDEYRMARKLLMVEVSGGRVRGRPMFGWMNGVKLAMGKTEMTAEDAQQCQNDRNEWRGLVDM